MKLLVQPLKREAFEVNTELSDDMTILKKKIAAKKLDMPAERLKIIHGGRLVEDDACTIGMLGIVPGDFVVVMVSKGSITKAADAAPTETTNAAAPTHAAPASASASPPSGVAGPEIGIETGRPSDTARSGDVIGSHAVDEVFEQMRASPNLAWLAQMVSDSPALIDPIVQALNESHPDLARAIDGNRERFLELLAQERGTAPEDINLNDVLLTREDEEAADRLASLGFTAEDAVKAYIRCERNEVLAASFLFQALKFEPGRAGLAQAASEWWCQQQAAEGEVAPPITCLQELTEDPMFGQLADTLAQSPDLLLPMVSALEQVHPDIAQVIAESPDQFMRMVRDSVQPAQQSTLNTSASSKELPEAVQLTVEDEEAVQRLCDLGYCQEEAWEAFLLCAKNEAYAAQALLEQASAAKPAPPDETDQDFGQVQLSNEDEAAITRLVAHGFERTVVVQAFLAVGRNEELAAGLLYQDTVSEVD